jgi:hypothetical protein
MILEAAFWGLIGDDVGVYAGDFVDDIGMRGGKKNN